MNTVSEYYIDGIKDGRAYLRQFGAEDAPGIIANIRSTMLGFPASTPVGQRLRGELAFWVNQISMASKNENQQEDA